MVRTRWSVPSPSAPVASSRFVMKSGVRFIICTISSAVCERTESMAGGRKGAVAEEAFWAFDLVEMGKGVSVDGGRGLDEL